MTAQQRAARIEAELRRVKNSRTEFPERGVYVGDNLVWNGRSRLPLGPLAGACAGVKDLREPSVVAEVGAFVADVVIGVSPGVSVGTKFVAFADGTRHETRLNMGSRAEMQAVDRAVAEFNAMVDAAESEPAPAEPALVPVEWRERRGMTRAEIRAENKATGTFSERAARARKRRQEIRHLQAMGVRSRDLPWTRLGPAPRGDESPQ